MIAIKRNYKPNSNWPAFVMKGGSCNGDRVYTFANDVEEVFSTEPAKWRARMRFKDRCMPYQEQRDAKYTLTEVLNVRFVNRRRRFTHKFKRMIMRRWNQDSFYPTRFSRW